MTIQPGKKTWALLTVFVAGVLLLCHQILQMLKVAAVQEAAERDWEISFTSSTSGEQFIRPKLLPEFVDNAVDHYLTKRYVDPAEFHNHVSYRYSVYHERFRALFRGPIREIHVLDPEGFRGDLGAALQRFPALRNLEVSDLHTPIPSEKEWELLCRRLRALPDLESLHLDGHWITDAALAPLSGHPRLRSIAITYGMAGGLSPACLKTFASIPNLQDFNIVSQPPGDDAWLTEALRAEMAKVRREIKLAQ